MVGAAPEGGSQLAASLGLSESEFRFAVSFFLSVLVSLLWRYVPSSKGNVKLASLIRTFKIRRHRGYR